MARPAPSIPTNPAQLDKVRLSWRSPSQAPALKLPARIKTVKTAADFEKVRLSRKAASQAPLAKGFSVPKTMAEFEKITSRRKSPTQAPNLTRIPK